MKNLYKSFSDVVRAPRSVLEKMNEGNFEYVTWTNSWTGARFLAKKETVVKMAHNKFAMKKEDHLEIKESEVVKISNSSLTTDEVKFELDANNADELTISEGFDGKEKTTISRKTINLVEEILYNENFDCSKLFN